jgi:hypothetical protein
MSDMHPEQNNIKSKYKLLQEFTAIIFKHDPMKTGSQFQDEYEAEALSILSRFCEAALHQSDSEAAVLEYAAGVVQTTFEFWFDNLSDDINLEPLMLELVKHYIESQPADQTKINDGVQTVTVG